MLHAHKMIPKVIQYYIVHTYLYPSIDQPNLMDARAPLENKNPLTPPMYHYVL